jgi:hypothetical protein
MQPIQEAEMMGQGKQILAGSAEQRAAARSLYSILANVAGASNTYTRTV